MDLKELKPKSRFNNRAENYDRYRPSYPESIINFLEETIGLSENSIIADIESGKGKRSTTRGRSLFDKTFRY